MSAQPLAYPAPPRVSHSVMELGRIFLEATSGYMLKPLMKAMPRGDGHSVMTLPGFMGADGSMASLRKFLDRQGYVALPWGQGRNVPEQGMNDMEQALEFRRGMEKALVQTLKNEVRQTGRRVSLVGWSLGGLYATGLAHRQPDLVRQVVTLGTPFGDPRATSIYAAMQRVYKAEVTAEMLDEWIGFTFAGDLQVPITALYSLSDGFVGAGIARLPEHPLTENIAVMASHVGFPFNPLVRFLLAGRLAQAEGQWSPCQRVSFKPFVHQPA
jgi:pimeloyl-ACP methyl ester carboxylesterase